MVLLEQIFNDIQLTLSLQTDRLFVLVKAPEMCCIIFEYDMVVYNLNRLGAYASIGI